MDERFQEMMDYLKKKDEILFEKRWMPTQNKGTSEKPPFSSYVDDIVH